MFPLPAFICSPEFSPGMLVKTNGWLRRFVGTKKALGIMLFCWLMAWATPAEAVILWSDLDGILANETGAGKDILGGAVKRDDSAMDTLYFKFHVNPLSDLTTEEYTAAFELYEGDVERLGVGNALKAWAYSAFFNTDETSESNQIVGYIDLHSSHPTPPGNGASVSYQFPRRGSEVTIVFKIQYVADGDDLVTVWLNPDLGPGATEAYQLESVTTKFNANTSFDEIRLRHAGPGGGWTFSDMAIATSFSDFVDASSATLGKATPGFAYATKSLTFRSWQRDQGLPNNMVRALTQTPEGYLWAGTDEGLARFDGMRFVTFGSKEGLYGGPVSALFGDKFGTLWIGTMNEGLISWQGRQTTTYKTRDGLTSNAITALAEDSQGQLWVGTDAGLAVRNRGQPAAWKVAGEFNGKAITALFKDGHGILWLGVKGEGVFKFADEKFVPLRESTLDDLLKDPHCLLVDHAGRIWIGAGDDSVLCCDGNIWHRFKTPRNLGKSFVSVLAEEPDGTVWVGLTGGGLLRVKDGELTAVPANSGLSGNLISSLAVDQNGKLWVGTDAGLNQMKRKNPFVLGQSEGLGFGGAQSLAEVAPGVIWAGKSKDGLYRWDGRTFNRLTAAGLSPSHSQVNTLLITRDGGCWVATAGGLLFYPDPRAAADEVRLFDQPKLNIISLAEGRTGELWAGTREGELWRLREGKWKTQHTFQQGNAITAIVPEAGGALWIGTDGSGLYRLKNTGLVHINKTDGLLSDSIRTLYLDAQGTLWIGTAGGGLSRWRAGQLSTCSTRAGLPDDTISQILEDDVGRLWLGNNRGIARVSKRELDEFAAGNIPVVHPQTYGREEGMLSEECQGGFFPAGLKAKSGLLWFSTLKGIAVMDPHMQITNSPLPTVLLEEVLVGGVPNSGIRFPAPPTDSRGGKYGNLKTEKLRIPPGRHGLELHYTGLNFDAPERIRFRYRLEGLDPDWVEAGTRRLAAYSYVPPGEYRFRVTASTGDGIWIESSSGLTLAVLRHFWQTWWFVSLASVGLLVSVGGAVRFVEKRKLHRKLQHLEQQQALERERTRIAHDLHDEMGAKLCRISFLSEHARRGELRPGELQDQITSISHASREVLHSLDEIVWAVNPQNDTLEHVASYIGQYAHEYFQMTGIECELDIPAQLPPHPLSSQARHHLFLAVHESLTNILKHSGATRAKVAMTCTAAAFEITATDNGKGFEPPVINANPASPSNSSGDGLYNMHQRLADIGGCCHVESSPGSGTTIRFALSLNKLKKA